jgi:hypothetical protein
MRKPMHEKNGGHFLSATKGVCLFLVGALVPPAFAFGCSSETAPITSIASASGDGGSASSDLDSGTSPTNSDGSSNDDAATHGDAAAPASNMFGAYALFPSDTSIFSNPNIDGAFIGFPWKKLQATSAAPDFGSIDTWLNAAVAAHSRLTIAIEAGAATPMWVYGTPADASQYLTLTDYAFQQQACQPNQIIPIPWKTGFLSAWTALVDAFAAHVSSNPAWEGVVAGIKLTGINNTTFETSLPYGSAQTHGTCVTTDAAAAWQAVGYTEDLVNTAWQTILPHFSAGFPGKPLIMDYIDLGFPAEYVGGAQQPKNNAVSTLLLNSAKTMLGNDRFIVEGTGLAANSGACTNLDSYATSGGTVGYQELYYVYNAPAPCSMSGVPNGTCDETVLHDALVYGIDHHMKYVELYSEDITGYPTEIAFAHTQLPPL